VRPVLLLLAPLALSGCATAVRELGSDALVHTVFHGGLHADFGLPDGTPLLVRTADGLVLDGRLYRPTAPPRGVVLFLHGRDCTRSMGNEAVRRFVKDGWAVATVDQRAHGSSGGEAMTYGAKEVDDARRVLEQVNVWPAVVMGVSMGAAVSLELAAREPRVVGVIAGAPFDDLRTIWRETTPSVIGDSLFAELVARADEKGGFDSRLVSPRRDAAAIHVPVLLLHGLADDLISPEHSRRLHRALGKDSELVLFTGVGHWDLTFHDQVWDQAERWLLERFPSERAAQTRIGMTTVVYERSPGACTTPGLCSSPSSMETSSVSTADRTSMR
jgi:pimeloyl-ACP methyl ester carboxylesterase